MSKANPKANPQSESMPCYAWESYQSHTSGTENQDWWPQQLKFGYFASA